MAPVQDRFLEGRYILCVDIWTDVQMSISTVQDAVINIMHSTKNTTDFIKLSG